MQLGAVGLIHHVVHSREPAGIVVQRPAAQSAKKICIGTLKAPQNKLWLRSYFLLC